MATAKKSTEETAKDTADIEPKSDVTAVESDKPGDKSDTGIVMDAEQEEAADKSPTPDEVAAQQDQPQPFEGTFRENPDAGDSPTPEEVAAEQEQPDLHPVYTSDDVVEQPEKKAKRSSKKSSGAVSDEDLNRVSRFLEHTKGKPVQSVKEEDGGFEVTYADGTGNVDHVETDDVHGYVDGLPEAY